MGINYRKTAVALLISVIGLKARRTTRDKEGDF